MIVSPADLRPGDAVFGPIGGWVGNTIVRPGQLALAPWRSLLSWRTWWRINHVAMVVETNPVVMIGQAMPKGFEIVPLRDDQWSADYVFIRPRYWNGGPGSGPLPNAAASGAAETLRKLWERKVGYGFAAYPRLAAHRLDIPVPRLDRHVQRTDAKGVPLEAICSQAIDWALTRAGGLDGNGHVFNDGRKPFDVVPSELYLRLLALAPAEVCRPGVASVSRGLSMGAFSEYGELPGRDAYSPQEIRWTYGEFL